ncbi:Mur ligase [Iodidimonas muriae]|uniref:Mur ligase n=1 Tax=Iodidimonas muriae TaxID=261467 RepID=A0ABQ2LCG3_9PROT|nr:UDP-N-acetylmuramoyl-tripeptide--D-alanyl-D-alanine ligase [Iodidimonas muriae]GER06748.1 Mur ligase [Kordiimonadales bacterium JCM 17843]GGO10146.1 Mur ligase [Iodidimonas muriae]
MTTAFFPYSAALILTALLGLVFAHQRGKAYLMYFQQEEYDAKRFRHWLSAHHGRDRATSIFALVAGGLCFGLSYGFFWLEALGWAALIIGLLDGIRRSRRSLLQAKKPLVMTDRAKRILQLHILFSALLTGLIYAGVRFGAPTSDLAASLIAIVVLAQASPYFLMLANAALQPVENRVKARFLEEARQKLRRLDPYIIGITGSYGKTSTKSILAHILSSAAPTLATPGSVNTEMGITRVVREQLEPEHRYFIVEMGAYGPGSIARLCRLAPPKLGVITAIGWAHYERFKQIETVFDAKFELADAVAQSGGTTIVNQDAIPGHLLKKRLSDGMPFICVGSDKDCTLRLVSADQTPDGVRLEIVGDDMGEVVLHAPLYGLHQAHNIMAATAAAHSLGMPIDAIRAALSSAPQSRHRLEVVRSGDITIIDDAYNSNPSGFASGLELLDILKAKDGRRILITPGMVELGEKHEEEHHKLGELAARHVDIALVVTPERIPSFVAAFEAQKPSHAQLLRFNRQEDAQNWIKAHAQNGDVILYENNLPDLYEKPPGF